MACVLTAANVQDSQVAIPLGKMTAARVTTLYDLTDSAYDVTEIADHSRTLGHAPIIDHKTRATARKPRWKRKRAPRPLRIIG